MQPANAFRTIFDVNVEISLCTRDASTTASRQQSTGSGERSNPTPTHGGTALHPSRPSVSRTYVAGLQLFALPNVTVINGYILI